MSTDKAALTNFIKKSRSELLHELENTKVNFYYSTLKIPSFLILVIFLGVFFPELAKEKLIYTVIGLAFLTFDLVLSLAVCQKKIDLLFQIEKNRGDSN